MIFVRDAETGDYEAIAQLHTLSYRNTYRGILSEDFLAHHVDDERRRMWQERQAEHGFETRLLRVAVDDDRVVGFVCVFLDDDERWGALLDNLHIHPSFQGRGLGRDLLTQAAAWVADRRPGSPMYLWVYEANHAAHGFYGGLGGVVAERTLNHAADGNDVPAVRYVWEDLSTLTGMRS